MRSLSSMLGLAPFDPAHTLVTSPFMSSAVLATFRLVFAVYTFAALAFSIGWGIVVQKNAAGFFAYFTHLSYAGLCAYFFAAGLQTALYARRGCNAYPLQSWGTAWRFLHLALLSTITAFPLLVSVVFWAILADSSTFDSPFDSWTAISVHLLNSVFALFEIVLTNTLPSHPLLLPFGIVLLLLYTCVLYITHATQGFYAYQFMAPTPGHPAKLALHILGVGAAECVIFGVVNGLVRFRAFLVRRYMAPKARGENAEVETQSIESAGTEKARALV